MLTSDAILGSIGCTLNFDNGVLFIRLMNRTTFNQYEVQVNIDDMQSICPNLMDNIETLYHILSDGFKKNDINLLSLEVKEIDSGAIIQVNNNQQYGSYNFSLEVPQANTRKSSKVAMQVGMLDNRVKELETENESLRCLVRQVGDLVYIPTYHRRIASRKDSQLLLFDCDNFRTHKAMDVDVKHDYLNLNMTFAGCSGNNGCGGILVLDMEKCPKRLDAACTACHTDCANNANCSYWNGGTGKPWFEFFRHKEDNFSTQDLSFLQNFTCLEELSINWCDKLDNESMVYIGNILTLNKLNLDNCEGFNDISPMSKLTNIEELSINNCSQVFDLKPLKNLSKLKKLDVRGTKVINTDVLSGIVHLEITK